MLSRSMFIANIHADDVIYGHKILYLLIGKDQ